MKYTTKAKVLLATAAFSLAFLGPASSALAAPYSVVVDGTQISNISAEMKNGQLMVALRPFVERLGGRVDWLASQGRATVSYNSNQTAFWMGTPTVYHNSQRMAAPVSSYLKSDRSHVPAWFLAVRLGLKVSFSGSTLYVETTGIKPIPTPNPGQQQGHPLMDRTMVFPFPSSARYDTFYDSWGDSRNWQGQRTSHEGTDILAPAGTPIVSAAPGTVVKYGWNTLGGYRVTIQLDQYPSYRYYYAHLDHYAPGLYLGAKISSGQLLGYVGSTGEGPERTEGRFVPHLHFGIYGPSGAVNPFPILKFWESNKVGW